VVSADAVEVHVEKKRLGIAADRQPKEGWAEAFSKAGPSKAEPLLATLPPNRFDDEEWTWQVFPREEMWLVSLDPTWQPLSDRIRRKCRSCLKRSVALAARRNAGSGASSGKKVKQCLNSPHSL
jgi:hypothetical protein